MRHARSWKKNARRSPISSEALAPAGIIASIRSGALCAALLFSTALLLAGCDDTPRLRPLAPDAVLLAFGDSLTHGTGVPIEQSYPAVLQQRIGRRVINAGVPGEVSADGLERLPALLERENPALVLLCHGGNDLLRKLDPAAAERNLREMVALARANGAQVLLIGVPRPGLFLGTADHYERVATDLELPFEPEALADVLGDNAMKSDAIHPNAAGYSRLAEAVEQLLRDAGAL